MFIRQNSPIYNPKPVLPSINSYTKFEENHSKNAKDRAWKPIFNIYLQSQTTPSQFQLLYKV